MYVFLRKKKQNEEASEETPLSLCCWFVLVSKSDWILFVVCETVSHLRRCGETKLVPRETIIKLDVVSNL